MDDTSDSIVHQRHQQRQQQLAKLPSCLPHFIIFLGNLKLIGILNIGSSIKIIMIYIPQQTRQIFYVKLPRLERTYSLRSIVLLNRHYAQLWVFYIIRKRHGHSQTQLFISDFNSKPVKTKIIQGYKHVVLKLKSFRFQS